MRIHSHRPTGPTASPYGAAGENAAWHTVMEAYRADRIEDAFQAAQELGAGAGGYGLFTFRMIEAEEYTRRHSTMERVSPLLSIEADDGAILDRHALTEEVVDAFQETANLLGLPQRVPTLVTFLAEEANTPWTPGRHGFCTPKRGFAKICIPHYLLAEPGELRGALRHEYAHALALWSAGDLCPTWLLEAISMAVEHESGDAADALFVSGSLPWLGESRLDRAFQADRESPGGRQVVAAAYRQSALIGRHLVRLRGAESLGRLLSAYEGGFADRLWSLVRSERPVDRALRKVYGLTASELFEQAKAALRPS